jgi:hypothetical protein
MDQMWTEWITSYRETRPRADRSPIGWYTLTDLRAAFNAGALADHERGLRIIVQKIQEAVREVEQ